MLAVSDSYLLLLLYTGYIGMHSLQILTYFQNLNIPPPESAFESLMRSIGSVGDKKLNAMASARSQYKTAKKALRVAVASSEHQVTQSAESPHLSLQTAKSLKKAITLRKREVAGNLDEMATAMEEASKEVRFSLRSLALGMKD